MYELLYLPGAQRDLVGIARHLSRDLKNPAAAERLVEELSDAGERLRAFPYANPVYIPVRPLTKEYRKVSVRNYLLFYWVDETHKQVTVARVIYGKHRYDQLIEGHSPDRKDTV